MAMSSFGKWLQKQKTNNNNQQTNSQCWGSPFHQHCKKNYEQTHQTSRDKKRSCTLHLSHNPWKLIRHKPIFPVASDLYTGYAGWTSNHRHGYSSSCPVPTKTLHQVAYRLHKGWYLRISHSLRCSFTGPQPHHSRSSHFLLIELRRRSYEAHSCHCVAMPLQQGTMHS